VIWFWVVVLVLVIGAVAVLAAGRDDSMSEAYEDRPDRTIPAGHALTSDDLQRVRFSSALRGYRMDEVDALIDRVAADLVAREADERAATPGSQDGSTPADDSRPQADPATTSTESSATADDAPAENTSAEGHPAEDHAVDDHSAEPGSTDESPRHREAGSAGASTGSTPS
jgi:DivIVA domain-containing protein